MTLNHQIDRDLVTLKHTQRMSWRAMAALSLTLGILWIAPWFTGLFFTPASTIATLVVGLISLVLLVSMRIDFDLRKPQTWVLIYAAYLGLTNLWAADVTTSLQITAGEMAAMLFFIVTSRYTDLINHKWTGYGAALIGIALYVFGMGAGVNWWTATDAVYDNHQLASVFQYHNTFAAIELAIAVIAYFTAHSPVISLSPEDLASVELTAPEALRRLDQNDSDGESAQLEKEDSDDESTQVDVGTEESSFTQRKTLLDGWWMEIPGMLAVMVGMNAVLGSESRVVWVMTPIVMLAMLLAKAWVDRSRWSFVRGFLAVVLGGATGVLTIKALTGQSAKYFILSFALDLVLSVLISWAGIYLRGRTLSHRQLSAGVSVLLLVLVGAGYKLRHHLFGSASTITHRLGTISLSSVSLQERFFYYKNALHMWLNAPVFGSGGGTWVTKYQAFQTLPYTSNQVHSTFFDVLLNGGLIGLALYIVVIAMSIAYLARFVRRSRHAQGRLIVLGFGIGAFTLFLHSLLDFDFAFGYFQLLFWMFLGIAVGTAVASLQSEGKQDPPFARMTNAQRRTVRRRKHLSWVGKGVTIVVGVFTVLAAVSLTGMQIAQEQATLPANQANPDAEYALAQTAASFAPYSATAQMDLAQYDFSTATSSNQPSLYNVALQEATAAASMSPWNAGVQSQASLIAYRLGNDPLALQWAERSYQDAHFDEADFRNMLGISMWAYAAQMKTNPRVAHAGLQSVLTLYERYHQSEHDINEHLFPDSTVLTEDASMQVYVATADYLLKDYARSLQVMNPLLTANRDQAAIALYMIDTVLDDAGLHKSSSESSLYLKQIEAVPSVRGEYNYLRGL